VAADDILTLAPPPADSRVAYGSDPNQFADLRIPKAKGPHPTIINIHGGFWRAKYNLDHTGHLCAALTSKGIATANLEYRRVGTFAAPTTSSCRTPASTTSLPISFW